MRLCQRQREQRVETLNESPSEKEGKYESARSKPCHHRAPSMKVPPKRKGNDFRVSMRIIRRPSMKVPPKRKGNMGPAWIQEVTNCFPQ